MELAIFVCVGASERRVKDGGLSEEAVRCRGARVRTSCDRLNKKDWMEESMVKGKIKNELRNRERERQRETERDRERE